MATGVLALKAMDSQLLALAPDDMQHGSWIDRMTAPISAILDELSDISVWLSEDRDRNAMAERLQTDIVPFKMMKIVLDRPDGVDPANEARLFDILKPIIEQYPLRLYGTCDWLLDDLRDRDEAAESLRQTLQSQRSAILESRRQIQESWKRPDPPLTGWIEP